MRIIGVAVVAGCWAGKPAPEPVSNHVADPPALFAISEQRFGPIDASADATLTSLRQLFAGYEVRPVNDGSLEYDVFDGAERLLFVVPSEDGKVFNVHATSARIRSEHGWRVGQPFHGATRLTTCECWGTNPTCWRAGEHIAVNFQRDCDGLTADGGEAPALNALDGVAVQRLIWSPKPFPALDGAGDPD